MQTPCSRSPCGGGGGGASHNAINLTFNAAQMHLSALCRSAAATPQICVMCTKENHTAAQQYNWRSADKLLVIDASQP